MATKKDDKKKNGSAAIKEDQQKAKNQKGNDTAPQQDDAILDEDVDIDAEMDSEIDEDVESDETTELDEGEELDALLEIMEEEEITALDAETSTAIVDEWYDFLHESDEADLKEIANVLKQLKKQITSSKVDEAKIGEMMSQLSEMVDNYADEAKRGYKTKLHKLSKLFSKAGKKLVKDAGEE